MPSEVALLGDCLDQTLLCFQSQELEIIGPKDITRKVIECFFLIVNCVKQFTLTLLYGFFPFFSGASEF